MRIYAAIFTVLFLTGDALAFTRSARRRGGPPHKLKGSSDAYIPTIGIESFIHSLGQSRWLLGNEYELAFENFQGLVELAQEGKWSPTSLSSEGEMKSLSLSELIDIEVNAQKDDSETIKFLSEGETVSESDPGSESDEINRALQFQETKRQITEKDVEESLNKFRKVVGGLEKYRITNPSLVADHYRNVIRMTLALEETWGAAANALSYAGFDIKAHVNIAEVAVEEEMPQQQIPVLQVKSVCSQAAIRLLDLEFSSNISDDAAEEMARSLEGTFDQRFFGQMEATQEKVQDMMLSILRVCVRAVLTRENTPFIVVDHPLQRRGEREADEGSLERWMPPLSAVKSVLSMDFQVVNEEEEGDLVRFFVANKPHGRPIGKP